MPLFLRNFILIFIMLWLPLQGFAAASMSVYPRSEQPLPPAQHDMTQASRDGGYAHHRHDQDSVKSDLSCDDCVMCHMGMPMVLVSEVFNIKPLSGIHLPPLTRFSQVYLEQPQRPPLVLSF